MKKTLTLVVLLSMGGLGAASQHSDTATLTNDGISESRSRLLVATGDKVAISVEEYETLAQAQSAPVRHAIREKDDQREQFLDKIINMRVMADEARRRGYAEHPEVETVKKNQLANYLNQKIKDEIDVPSPTEAQLEAYYQENIHKYQKPESVRIRHIVLTDKTAAQHLLAEITAASTTQFEFRKLAQKHSTHAPSRNRGGDLGFVFKDGNSATRDTTVDRQIVNAAFSLKSNGAIVPTLVKTDSGYHIVMRTGYRQASHVSFADAKDRLEKIVTRQHRDDLLQARIDKLKKKYDVALYEENLKHVVIDLSGSTKSTMYNAMPSHALSMDK